VKRKDAETVETEPDAWARFEEAVGDLAPPQEAKPKLLPSCFRTYFVSGDQIAVGAWERSGFLHYQPFRLSDLPNDLVGKDVLESLGIHVVQG
jgi:hypothetical protein